MGKWDRRNYARPRRRYYRDYHWSPPPDEPIPDPESEVWQDNVPMWEKKFCYLVGRMSWKKVLSTKNFMHCHSNVLSWDDSAGEEAFITSKKRFWEEYNGLPCETQLPDPDMYIDEVNWNPYIDPDIVRELDQAYFNPDDKYYLPSISSSKVNSGWPEDGNDSWEHGHIQSSAAKDNSTSRDQWRNSVDETSNLTKDNDPWESYHTQENNASKNDAWGGSWNKSWDSKPNGCSDTPKDWRADNNTWNPVGTIRREDNAWGGSWNKSWDSRPNDHFDTSNNWRADNNTWKHGGTSWQDSGPSSSWNQKTGQLSKPGYVNNSYKTQASSSHQGSTYKNSRETHWGQQRRDNCYWKTKDSSNIYRGGNQYNAGCRKREGPDHYAAHYKGPRLQGDDYQSSRHWNADNNKRVSFGNQWS